MSLLCYGRFSAREFLVIHGAREGSHGAGQNKLQKLNGLAISHQSDRLCVFPIAVGCSVKLFQVSVVLYLQVLLDDVEEAWLRAPAHLYRHAVFELHVARLWKFDEGKEPSIIFQLCGFIDDLAEQGRAPGHIVTNDDVCVAPVQLLDVTLADAQRSQLNILILTGLLDLLDSIDAKLCNNLDVFGAFTAAELREHNRGDRTGQACTAAQVIENFAGLWICHLKQRVQRVELDLSVSVISVAEQVLPFAFGPTGIDDIDLGVNCVDDVGTHLDIIWVNVPRREVPHPNREIDWAGSRISVMNPNLNLIRDLPAGRAKDIIDLVRV